MHKPFFLSPPTCHKSDVADLTPRLHHLALRVRLIIQLLAIKIFTTYLSAYSYNSQLFTINISLTYLSHSFLPKPAASLHVASPSPPPQHLITDRFSAFLHLSI
jgi:hypothetical protein